MSEGLRGGRPCPTPSLSSSMSAAVPQSSAMAVMPVTDGAVDPQMQNWDNNLGALCQHVQAEGWNSGAFSDIVVQAMGSTFYLHRLLLSRSSYFRHMLQGPWREAGKPEVALHIDDENVNAEAVATALAYLYGIHPQLDDSNAFRVLAAASFLDLQDLCALCTDFIISELWTENFLGYQAFAESQDYGVHGERVRKACWGYLCRGGSVELREILPKLSIQTLRNLLTSDELWVPSEEKRFELALSVLVARGGLLELNTSHVSMALEAESAVGTASASLSSIKAQEQIQATKVDGCNFGSNTGIEGSKVPRTASSEKPIDQVDVNTLIQSTILELADSLVAMQVDDHACLGEKEQPSVNQQLIYVYGSEKDALTDKFESAENTCEITKPQLCKNTDAGHGEACATNELAVEGSSIGHMSSDDFWSYRDHAGHCSFSSQPSTSFTARSSSTQSRDGSYTSPSWGGRVVERRLMKAYPTNAEYTNNDDWEAFISVFEGGGILYCHMAFEDLLNMRGQLEELGFPCKSVADGLWLQTLLRQQVLTIAADTCKNCCYVYPSCNCRQGLVYPHTRIPASNYHRDDQERNTRAASMGSYPLTDAQGGVNGSLQGRVHVRGTMDGLAGIGRGTTFGPPGTPWPSSRFVFSRVPIGGHSNRCSQQNVGNDQVDGRFEVGAVDLPTQCANGLTAVVGLTQGLNSSIPLHSDQSGRLDDQPLFSRVAGEPPGGVNLSNANVFKVDSQEQTLGQEWEACQGSSISLDLQTPLRNFPPFRFGVEFDDVHRLADGQSKHSPEAFYAGSLWKVSVQAFNDEDPRGRRTLGLFLHRRKADEAGPYRKVSLYTDSREKVKARYQLICPAKRGVMILGNLTQAGTLLPKAPKGWGWRTAFLFDELADLLQGSSLRVAAVVQLV